jgi:hypothetical protein
LNDSVGRVKFARHLYNLLCVELDQEQEQDVKDAIDKLHRRIKSSRMKSMYTRDMTSATGRKRAGTDNGDSAGGGGGDDRAQLRARGYEVKPEVLVDACGGKWEPRDEVWQPFLLF